MAHQTSFYPDADTYIDSNHSATNFGNCIINWIGKKKCDKIYRTLLKFNIFSLPTDAIIAKATLKLYVDYAKDPDVIGRFTPYAIISPWEETEVTWDTCPAFDSSLFGSTTSIGGVRWYEWDITQIVNAWFLRKQDNYGILLKSDNRSTSDGKRLIGRKSTKENQIAFRPVLSVCYELPQPFYNNVSLIGRNFIEKSLSVKTTGSFLPTAAFNTSQQSQATFFIINTGANSALIRLEIGPNDADYVYDDVLHEVQPGKTIAIVPRIFAKYTRVIYKSENPLLSTSLKIIFQSCV